MKKSKKVRILKIGNKYFIFSGLTNSLCEVSKDIMKMLSKPSTIKNENLLKELKKALIIVPSDFNERKYIHHSFYIRKFSQKSWNFIIVPTYKCNLHCIYCYQGPNKLNTMMNEKVITQTINFITLKIEESNPVEVIINLYGGEPLLHFSAIEKILIPIKKICAEKNINFLCTLITNGILIREYKEKIYSLDIQHCQITIDGPSFIHNKRRVFKNKKGTYKCIMENVKELLKEGKICVHLRINVDYENYNLIFPFVKEVIFPLIYRKRATVELLPTIPYICGGFSRKTFTTKDFALYYLHFIKKLKEEKLLTKISNHLPIFYPIVHNCGWKNLSSFIISPNGDLYICWGDLGDKQFVIGNIFDGIDLFKKRTQDWLFSDNESTIKCKDCELVYSCAGGCKKKWEILNYEDSGCSFNKFTLKEFLYFHIQLKEQIRKCSLC